jgi:hypothetical protein
MPSIYQKFALATASTALSFAVIEANPAQAVLLINSQSAVVNIDTQEAFFTLEFNQVPDFFSLDEAGRQADSFQYFIDADGGLPVFRGSPYFSELETIIRGEEIHVAGDIRVRNVLPSSDEPNSGGWGTLRGSVPYNLNGTVLTFSTPLELIGDSDGLFSYRLEAYEFGGLTDINIGAISVVRPSPPTSVPEPSPALGLGILGLAGLVARKRLGSNSTTSLLPLLEKK